MSKNLIVIEQRKVTFYDDRLTAIRASDGQVYVSVRHMCEALGLAQRGQVLRIKRNEILLEGYEGGIMMITPGGRQRVGMLRVDVALVLSKRTGHNEYGGVYSELYRRYRIPSYRELPVNKYEDAIKWLGDWLQSLTGDEAF